MTVNMFNDRQSVIVDHFVVSQMIVTAQMAYSEFASCLCNDFFFLFFLSLNYKQKKLLNKLILGCFAHFIFLRRKQKYNMK